MERAYTLIEFCHRFKIGRTKAYQEINSRRLKAVKCGAKTIIRADDAEEWLANLTASEAKHAA